MVLEWERRALLITRRKVERCIMCLDFKSIGRRVSACRGERDGTVRDCAGLVNGGFLYII